MQIRLPPGPYNRVWYLLDDALMRACAIAECNILRQYSAQVPFSHDEEVVEIFLVTERTHQLSGLLRYPPIVWWMVHPAKNTRQVPNSMKNSTYTVLSQMVSIVKKSQVSIYSR